MPTDEFITKHVVQDDDVLQKSLNVTANAFEKAENNRDRFTRALQGQGDDVRRASRDVDTLSKSVEGLEGAYRDANGRLRDANGRFLKDTNATNDAISRSLGGEGLARFGGYVRSASETLTAFSDRMVQAGLEGQRADEKLNAMLETRGEGGKLKEMADWAGDLAYQAALIDDDPIKEASAGLLGFGLNAEQIQQIMPGLIGQSRLYNQSLDQTAMSFGKAYASGNAGVLRRVGVTISPEDMERLKGISDFGERQRAMFDVIKKSMDDYALSITQGMSESEKATNRFALTMDETTKVMGDGASDARAAWQGMLAPLLDNLNQTNPELLKLIGATAEYGAIAARTMAPVIDWGMKAADMWTTYRMMQVLSTGATTANTIATNANTAAQIANARAATAAGIARSRFAGGPGGAVGAGLLGVGLGVLGYEGLRASGALGDDAPGAGEAATNAAGRIGSFFMGQGLEGYDHNVRGAAAEAESKRLMERMRKRNLTSGPGQATRNEDGSMTITIPPIELPSTFGDDLHDDAVAYAGDY